MNKPKFDLLTISTCLFVLSSQLMWVPVSEGQTLSTGTASPFVGSSEFRVDVTCFNAHQCEFQEYQNPNNLALAGPGGAAIAVTKNSGPYVPLHAPQFINDGHYGNGSSWIPGTTNSWLKIDLGAVRDIQTIKFGRDRIFNGSLFNDRDPGNFTIEVADLDSQYSNGNENDDDIEYTQVFASSFDGLIDGGETLQVFFASAVSARFIKMTFASANAGNLVAVDEVEVLGPEIRCDVGHIELVSVDDNGLQGQNASFDPSLSDDGNFVGFISLSDNLVIGDLNNRTDTFVRDLRSGTTRIVSISSSGLQGNNGSFDRPSLSQDGRFVAFSNFSVNLAPGDINGHADVFIHDLFSGTTDIVSVDSFGSPGLGMSSYPAINATGELVAFESSSSNLVEGDENGWTDIFVHDRVSDITERVSVSSAGTEANSSSSRADISGNGRFVVFESGASNLVSGDTNHAQDIYIHDRYTNTTNRLSISSSGDQAEVYKYSFEPSISFDGDVIAFSSQASNLVPGDTNGVSDIFVRIRSAGITRRVSVAGTGAEANDGSFESRISADARYVSFTSSADNLVLDDTNNSADVFLHDLLTGNTVRVSSNSAGEGGNTDSHSPTVSADGNLVAFSSGATNLVPNDDNFEFDIFVHNLANCSNQRPGAFAVAAPNPAECSGALTEVQLDGSGSFDPDPADSLISWDWGGDVSASGEQVSADFGPGSWNVELTVEDTVGATDSDSIVVTVEDTTPPLVSAGGDATLEATSAAGAPYAVPYAIDDACDPSPSFSVVPMPAVFPLGTTTVTVSASDSSGNSASDSADVTVEDTTAPAITVPADIFEVATSSGGNSITFAASAGDIVDGPLTPDCVPASGSTFAHGTTGVSCSATDAAGNAGSAGFAVTVLNASPTADSQSVTLNEDTPAGITLTGADPDGYPSALIFELVDPPANGSLGGAAPNLTYTPNLHYFGADSFTFRSFDGGSYSDLATVSITVNPVNDPPVVSVDRASAGLQYSDTIGAVVITATDFDDALGLASAWTLNGGAANVGLPAALEVTGGCTPSDFGASPRTGSSCSWTFSGQMLQPSGDYDVTFTVTDEGGGTGSAASVTASTELLVAAENASIDFDGANPVAVPVIAEGVDASEPFSLLFQVRETPPDAASFAAVAGDISQAIPEVSVKLTPVGPGSAVNGVCDASDNGLGGYGEILTFSCDFDAVPVNTYSVDVSVNGGYYTGSDDDVLTVYDPSLGFTTGGGWFYWPGTSDKTTFGYSMKYTKKRTNIQGGLLLIRHIEGAPEGEDKWRLKSNALVGLSLGDGGGFGWAAFSGKASFEAPGANAEGNHSFTAYVEDSEDPGAGFDRFWIQARDRANQKIADLTLDDPAVDEAVTIEGGNIYAPHRGNGKP